MALQTFKVRREQDPVLAVAVNSEITPKNWHRFPGGVAAGGPQPINVPTVSYNWPYNGVVGNDVNVATANATGPYEPKNQGNKANKLGLALAVDVGEPAGWIGPQEPYAPAPTPTLTARAPTSIAAVHPDTVMLLTGTNFMPGTQIKIAGNLERTTYISPTQVQTIIRATSFVGVDPAITLQVVNADKASNTMTFAVT